MVRPPCCVLEAVIFNMHKGKLVNETASFLRHAVGQWYADITKTAIEGAIFSWQHAYLGALKRLRTAALRWAHTIITIRRHYVSRKVDSRLTEQVSEENRERFKMIITVGPRGHSTIAPRWQAKYRGQSTTWKTGPAAHTSSKSDNRTHTRRRRAAVAPRGRRGFDRPLTQASRRPT